MGIFCRLFCRKTINDYEKLIAQLNLDQALINDRLMKLTNENKMLADLNAHLNKECDDTKEGLIQELTINAAELDKLKQELAEMKKQVDLIIPPEILGLADSMNSKYPLAKILYTGYPIRLKDKTLNPEIHVQDFITPLWSHFEWIEARNLTLEQYLAKSQGISFGEVLNKLMFDIYQAWAPTKRYEYDSNLYGISEYWSPAIDSWYVKRMDCENSSIELIALFMAAGIKGPLSAFTWVVCGDTPLGGHATVECYDFKLGKWRHLESTATSVPVSGFDKLPFHDDANDKLNITNVWFSFNSEISRSEFKTDAARESYNKRERFRNFVIHGN